MTQRPLERKTTEARLRYRASMSGGVYLDPCAPLATVSAAQKSGLERRRTRQSFSMGGSRIDPSSFIRTGEVQVMSVARQQFHKTNFENASLGMSPTEASSAKPRRVSLIDPPRAPPGKEEIQHKIGRKIAKSASPLTGDAADDNSSFVGSASVNNNSLSLNSVVFSSPQRNQTARSVLSELSPPIKTHVKVNVQARLANHMDTTVIAPPRKNSRWSRKKSLDASKAAFLQMTSPKKYGFNPPPKVPEPVSGHGVTKAHPKKTFQMVVSSRQAVNPPWATDFNS